MLLLLLLNLLKNEKMTQKAAHITQNIQFSNLVANPCFWEAYPYLQKQIPRANDVPVVPQAWVPPAFP